ncbi:MAG: DAK2 domain-containing protein, partial [Oscillospiraceae bacterium]|nr:DAK2 domain-containing protein [Oscillospiraceae bacterium]
AGVVMTSVFRDLGVDGVISGGQTMNPSTEDILREIARTPAEVVFVLPNNKNIIMAAQQCVGLVEGKEVVVVPTRTVPQGISAMLVLDPEADTQTNAAAMEEARNNVRTSEITYAARDSDFDGFEIHEGDYMALAEGQLFGTDRAIGSLLERLAQADTQQNAEFISIFYGEDVTENQAGEALAIFQKQCPNAEITLLSGGQPVYYYMISAE